jgi:hypothetical protein
MSFKALITTLSLAGLLAVAPLSSRADDKPPPPNMPQGKEWCQKNPEKCAEMRQQRDEWCKSHADECEKMKAKRAEHEEWCKANPEECKKQREERREKMHKMKEKCDADPAKCEERKKEMREHWEKNHGGGQGQGNDAKPNS